jgi:hypothetical protein
MMRLLPRLPSFVFPLCATIGRSGFRYRVRSQRPDAAAIPISR